MIDILHGTVAVLIDADNAQLNHIKHVMRLAEYYGALKICRAYGDWNSPPLVGWKSKIEGFGVECVQVNRIGKNATDHRLLVEAGEIMAGNLSQEHINTFIIVSSDGDFASACEFIRERHQVVGIGQRKQASLDLQKSCDEFYFLEDIEDNLRELKEHHPIPPNEVRDFFNYLFHAYWQLTKNTDWVWVSYSQLGKKLHEITKPDYQSRFGNYTLSEWLKNYQRHYESQDQMVRKIDPNPESTRHNLLIRAYLRTKRPDNLSSLGELGKVLRELARDFDEQFGGKKLSEWIEDYPYVFQLRGNYVIHRNHCEE